MIGVRSARDVRYRRARRTAARAGVCVIGGLALLPLVGGGSAAADVGDLVIHGHGFGHGRGMGQYGALGYAIDHGWTSEQILDHFYGGTAASAVDPETEITVRVLGHDGRALEAQVSDGRLATHTGGAPTAAPQRAVRIEVVSGGLRISDAPSCSGPWTTRSGTLSVSELRVRPAAAGILTPSYGTATDVPVVGDWDGDGLDSLGVRRGNEWHLRNSTTSGPGEISYAYGASTDTGVVGDWNGDGVSTVGVLRGDTWYLRLDSGGGPSQRTVVVTDPADGSPLSGTPVVGDWDGDGVDGVGIRNGAAWYLRDSPTSGPAQHVFAYGISEDSPVVGDWDGDGAAGVGVNRAGTWHLRQTPSGGTAQTSFTALGAGVPLAGSWWGGGLDLVGRAASGAWALASSNSGNGGQTTLLDADDLPLDRTLQLCHAAAASSTWSSTAQNVRYYRGELRQVSSTGTAGGARVVNAVGTDWYLRGVVPRESPAFWGTLQPTGGGSCCTGQEALEAQAVAARSYALAENRAPYAKTCDTISCQVYLGRASRAAGGSVSLSESPLTTLAVASTAGGVRRFPAGGIARTEFSSSTGGWTVGATFPSVRDDGDDTSRNANHDWTRIITKAQLEARYGLGTFQSAVVTARTPSDGGRRAASVELRFSGGVVTRTGDQFRLDWGLLSTWFDFTGAPAHDDGAGVRRGNAWYLRTSASGGPAEISFGFGVASDVPVVGDWDGDGRDGPGVRRGNVWYVRNALSSGGPDAAFGFGVASDVPVVGDWNGDRRDGPGVRRGNVWYVRNALSSGGPDAAFGFGAASDVPVVGDWNGDGRDDPGVFRSGTFYLRDSTTTGPAQRTVASGLAGVPIAGDWNGDGRDEVGVVSGKTWTVILDLANPVERSTFGYGIDSDVPVPGRWG